MSTLAQVMRLIEEEKNNNEKPLPLPEVQKEVLTEYLHLMLKDSDLQVGDWVKLTRLGKQRYRVPHDNQLCVVVRILPEEVGESDFFENGVVALLTHQGVHTFCVDLRMFERAELQF